MNINTIRKQLIGAVGAALLGAAILLPASAGAANTAHYGPIASTSPDSGTCGNDWATDTFDRHYKVSVTPNVDGTYNVTQQFKKGTFVTSAGASPGACEASIGPIGNGNTVGAGVTGKMHGSFQIVVTDGTFNASETCATGCDTTLGFIAKVFGPGASYDVPTFSFHYSAGNNGEWKNASADRGGNHGDITGSP